MKFSSYFRVSSPGGRPRFESVDKAQAIQFAQTVYKAEAVICEIEEIQR